jgi:PAS domain S-box-containing protein
MLPGTGISGHDIPAQELLRDYELRFRTLAEHVTMGLFQVTHGDDSRILSSNPVLAQMLGYNSPDELTGKLTRDLFVRSADIDVLANDLEQDGSVTGREILMKRKEGSEIRVSVQAWKLNAPGNPVLVIEGLVEDVTEHWVFEQEMQYHESELNRYALALAQVNKKLNLLSSITRHDILNKLTGLQGYMELMKVELMKGDFTETRIQEYLAKQEDIIRMITLQIQFTKDYQDIGIMTPQWFNVKETIETATSAFPLNGITLTIETGNLSIYADPLLEKVFYNLVENALRHGGNLTRISFTTEISGDGARIICEDDGSGVPEQFKEAIFVRKHFKHTGFGLFLSRDILGITGLSIRENGEPGKGARFEIAIPREYFHIGDAVR